MIKPGDVFRSKDKRMPNRHVKVITADSEPTGYAQCAPCTPDGRLIAGRTTRIRLQNLERRWRKVEGE